MTKRLLLATAGSALVSAWLTAQRPEPSVTDRLRLVEVASVADAMEQLYGQRGHMSHEMRPLMPTKFAGPAVTVMLKKEEHKDGPMYPFIEKYRSIAEAVKQFGRI